MLSTDHGTTAHSDLDSMNLQLLLVAREMARTSPAEAHIRFGLDANEVELLKRADIDKLRLMSSQGKASFRPMFSSRDLCLVN